jgi:hypothetical protein
MSYDYVRFLAYVTTSHHANLSKMCKHWGSFLSHCTSLSTPILQKRVLPFFALGFLISRQPSRHSTRRDGRFYTQTAPSGTTPPKAHTPSLVIIKAPGPTYTIGALRVRPSTLKLPPSSTPFNGLVFKASTTRSSLLITRPHSVPSSIPGLDPVTWRPYVLIKSSWIGYQLAPHV